MRTLRRYLWREIALSCLATFAALLALFWFFDLMAELGDTGRGQYRTAQAMLYVTLQLPSRLYELMPIGALIGGLLALGQLHASSEYTIFRASGLSQWRIGAVLLQGGLILALLTLMCGEWVAPRAMQYANEMKLAATNTLLAREFRSGLWVRQQHSFINVREVLPNKNLRDITVYRFSKDRQLSEVMRAKEGHAARDDVWTIHDVSITHFKEQTALTRHIATLEWESGITPALLSTLLVKPEQMSLQELYQYIGHLQQNQQKVARYKAAFWNKVSYPLVSLVMLVLAIPFAAVNRRQGGAGARLLGGILIGLSFYLVNKVSVYVAQQGDSAGPASALIAPLLFVSIASVLIWRQEKR